MAKTVRAASLVRLAKIPGLGWRRGPVIKSKNGRVRDAILIAGVEHAIPADSQFQIRSYEHGQAVYTGVGTDYEAALQLLERTSASRALALAEEALGIRKPEPVVEQRQPTLQEQLDDYLAKKNSASLSLTTTSKRFYAITLQGFVAQVTEAGAKFASDVTESDITAFLDYLKREGYAKKIRTKSADGTVRYVDGERRGYSKKSITMKYVAVRGFLRTCGVQVDQVIDTATHKRLAKKIGTNTNPYTPDELDRLFAACDDYYRNVFTFLLSTGLRFREAAHLTWNNIDLARGLILVPGEQRINRRYRDRATGKITERAFEFQSKSRKGREVPIFDSLRPMLEKLRAENPQAIYVFGTRSDLPNNHWIEYGKWFWKKAGLNCGVCDGCKHNECEQFYLHKFRHTYAHRCLDAGIPIYKVSRWMGHHSIEVTAIYLSGGSTAADRDPFAATEKAVAA